MDRKQTDALFKRVAQRFNTTAEEVRAEILNAMKDGQNCADPCVQARWTAIPKKGAALTIEEFLDFLLSSKHNEPV